MTASAGRSERRFRVSARTSHPTPAKAWAGPRSSNLGVEGSAPSMSIRAIVWAFDAQCPTPAAKLVLILLANQADDDGLCSPSCDAFLQQCGMESAEKEVASLVGVGLLRRIDSEKYSVAFVPPDDPISKNIIRRRERRRVIFEKTKGYCYYCDTSITLETFQIDHRIPRAAGGSNLLENLVPSCGPCNASKGASSAAEFISRLRRSAMKAR